MALKSPRYALEKRLGIAVHGSHISMPRPADLPDFDNPPVVETVLSAQFESIAGLHTAHLGLLWGEFRAKFPNCEERPPLDQIIEQFPETPRARVGLQLQALENLPVPRLCFLNQRGNEMIQVQANRFIKNWRKEGEGEQYPHYDETIKPMFERDFATFVAFLKKHQFEAPAIDQCEVTYVNHILSGSGDGWETFGDFDEIFNFSNTPRVDVPGRVEDLRIHARFAIPDDRGEPIGRLHVDIQPAFRTSDNRPMYVFHLTARGQMGSGFEFLDVGRRWIVKSFTALTTPKMHRIWRRKSAFPS
jgi:uncharacterized protein (TIGR04255 family)